MESAWKETLSQEGKVALLIHEHNQKDESIYFAKLVKELKSEMSRATVSKIIDRLFDMGMLKGEWITHNNKWIRSLHTSGEYKKRFDKLSDLHPKK